MRREIVAVALLAGILFTFVSRHWSGTGVAGARAAAFAGWMFGDAADIMLGLAAFCCVFAMVGRWKMPRAKRFGYLLVAVLVLAVLQLRSAFAAFADLRVPLDDFVTLGAQGRGGGVIGALLCYPLVRLLDGLGTEIALGFLGVVAALLISDKAMRRGCAVAVVAVAKAFWTVVSFIFRGVVAAVVFLASGFWGLVSGFARADDPSDKPAAEPKTKEVGRRDQRPSPLDVEAEKPRTLPRINWPIVSKPPVEAATSLAAMPEPVVADPAPAVRAVEPAARFPSEPLRIRQYDAEAEAIAASEARAAIDAESAERSAPLHGAQLSQSESETVYQLPPLSLLGENALPAKPKAVRNLADQARLLEETLLNFGVQAKVVQVDQGPVVTRYELQPAPGVKVSRIVSLADDIALSLAAADVRIEAPIPGKAAVGIEVPNKEVSVVHMREVLASAEFQRPKTKLAMALGKDIAGASVVADLADMPHLLIAGATGSGKSVCMNTMIASILYRQRPDTCKVLMVDPKRVELATYDGIPHLLAPVVTDPKKAAAALKWVVEEMEKRYELFAASGVRNIEKYNEVTSAEAQPGEPDRTLPFIVVFIDELADLMIVAAADVEDSICRLAQMARAAGIHLVIATQRPSVDVITGLIKANIPSRIAFAVSSQVDSRTILDMAGAERLLGRGDMLFCPVGAPKPLRVQGAYIADKEVEALVEFWKRQGQPDYRAKIMVTETRVETETGDDELFDDAINLVLSTGSASISMVQRRFRIGYARAARLIDMMELAGIVGPYQGSKPREILVDHNPRQQ